MMSQATNERLKLVAGAPIEVSSGYLQDTGHITVATSRFTGFNPPHVRKPNCADTVLVDIISTETGKVFMFGVLDGHGVNGHVCSNFVAKSWSTVLPVTLRRHSGDLRAALVAASDMVHNTWSKSHRLASLGQFSGTTCSMVVIYQQHQDVQVVACNIGDSSTLLYDPLDSSHTLVLPKHTFEDPVEKLRCETDGDPCSIRQRVVHGVSVGPLRVYEAHGLTPGLAMSRSIGDLAAHNIGVTHCPDTLVMQIEDLRGKLLVIGSDGVFDMMTPEEVFSILDRTLSTPDPIDLEPACEEITRLCSSRWASTAFIVDDISLVVVHMGTDFLSECQSRSSIQQSPSIHQP